MSAMAHRDWHIQQSLRVCAFNRQSIQTLMETKTKFAKARLLPNLVLCVAAGTLAAFRPRA